MTRIKVKHQLPSFYGRFSSASSYRRFQTLIRQGWSWRRIMSWTCDGTTNGWPFKTWPIRRFSTRWTSEPSDTYGNLDWLFSMPWGPPWSRKTWTTNFPRSHSTRKTRRRGEACLKTSHSPGRPGSFQAKATPYDCRESTPNNMLATLTCFTTHLTLK